MTYAVCEKCGTRKFGAFSPCDQCGFTPVSSGDQAKAILLSDHHHTHAELDVLTNKIRSGQPIAYDPVALALQQRTNEMLDADPDALSCKICGEDVDWYDDVLCHKCKEQTQNV